MTPEDQPNTVTLRFGLAQLARWALVAVAVIAVFASLRVAAIVFLPVVVAVWLGVAVWPMHAWVARRTTAWVGAAASALVVTVLAVAVVGAGWYAADAAIEEFRGSEDRYEQRYREARSWLIERGLPADWVPPLEAAGGEDDDPADAGSPDRDDDAAGVVRDPDDGDGDWEARDDDRGPASGPDEDPPPDGSASREAGDSGREASWFARLPDRAARRLAMLVSGGLGSLLSVLASVLLTIFLMVLMLAEADRWRGVSARVLTAPVHAAARGVTAEWGHQVRRFLLAKTISGVVSGGATALWLWFMGVPLPVVWGVLTLMLNYIPNIGALISGVPPTLLALLNLGLGEGLLVAGGLIAIEVLVGNLLDPLLQSDFQDLSAFLVLASVLFWGWLWGVVGAALAVPLTSLIVLALRRVRLENAAPDPAPNTS